MNSISSIYRILVTYYIKLWFLKPITIQDLGYNSDKIAGPQSCSYKGKTLYEPGDGRQ